MTNREIVVWTSKEVLNEYDTLLIDRMRGNFRDNTGKKEADFQQIVQQLLKSIQTSNSSKLLE